MAATTPRDLTPAGTWVGTTLSNLWLWYGHDNMPSAVNRLLLSHCLENDCPVTCR